MRCFLALNYGSSSLKYSVFREEKEIRRGRFSASSYDDFKHLIFKVRDEIGQMNPYAVIHRFVHGGEHRGPMLLKDDSLKLLEELVPLNPLHNSISMFCIRISLDVFPNSKHYAVFDTDFHTTIPPEARLYGVDYTLYEKGVKRYGFHGLSYSYVLRRVKELLAKDKPNIIALHLGAGSSVCAIKNGVSVETSMGFSPLEGLMMMTRPGDIDAAIVLRLLEGGMTIDEVRNYLYRNSGLKAITGVSDFRELVHKLREGDKIAELAFKSFVHRILKYIGAYWFVLEGVVDSLVFCGGIGENSPELRAEICKRTRPFGIEIDEEANSQNLEVISSPRSKVKIFVIRTNEELEMVMQVINFENSGAAGFNDS